MRRFPARVLARSVSLIGPAVLVAACSAAGPVGGPDPTAEARPTQAAAATPDPAASAAAGKAAETIAIAHAPVAAAKSGLGRTLVDGEGRTLYYFDQDKDGVPSCYGECAETWRPYLTHGAPEGGDGVTSHLLGTADRTDDTTQVTYAGRPLYHYAKDSKPGETTGNGVKRFGGEWHAVTPKGKRP